MSATECIEELAKSIDRAPSLVWANEYDLQAALAEALARVPGATVTREVRLQSPTDRIDLTAEFGLADFGGSVDAETRIGIEVKVKGALAAVVRQLTRYAKDPSIDGLILVTTKASHHAVPRELEGKPVRLVSLVSRGI